MDKIDFLAIVDTFSTCNDALLKDGARAVIWNQHNLRLFNAASDDL